MSAQPVDIEIFGRSLRVNCPPEQQEALNAAAADLDQRLQDLKVRTRVNNTEQLVFIAALNICHELAQEKIKPAIMLPIWNIVSECCNRPLNRHWLSRVVSATARVQNSNNTSWNLCYTFLEVHFLWDVCERASPLSRYFIPTECGASLFVCMPGPSGKPNNNDDMFTLNQGFKGYSPQRHPGDLLVTSSC